MGKLVVLALLVGFTVIRARHRPGYRAQRRAERAPAIERALVLGVTLGTFLPAAAYLGGLLDAWTLSSGPGAAVAGGGVGALGLLLFARTHAALGLNFSPLVDLREGHTLVRHGPYAVIRHPMYTAGFVLYVGMGLASANPAMALPPLVALTALVGARLPREEAMLAERFGAEWAEYAAGTGRLLPRIGAG